MFSKGLKNTLKLALGACIVGTSVAAADFPTRDIRLIVPWPAGGGADAISRKISNLAEQDLPKSIYVENIGGAAGILILNWFTGYPLLAIGSLAVWVFLMSAGSVMVHRLNFIYGFAMAAMTASLVVVLVMANAANAATR